MGLGTHCGVGHSRETLGLNLWGWALQGDSGLGRGKRLWGWSFPGSGTPGTLWDSRDERGVGEEKSSGRGEELSLRSNNPTPRVGNKMKRIQMHSKRIQLECVLDSRFKIQDARANSPGHLEA